MKFFSLAIITFFIVLGVKAEIKIAVVDTSTIVERSIAFVKAKKIIEEEFTKSEANASKIQEKFVKKYENLEKQKNIISIKEYNKEKNILDKEAQVEQKILYNQRASLNKELSNINQILETKLTEIIKKLAERKHISIVLNKAVTLYTHNSIDMTSAVVSEANQGLKSININLPNK